MEASGHLYGGSSCPTNYTIDHTYTPPGFIAVLTEPANSSEVGWVTVHVTDK
jgi:hypothetical protein